MPVPALSSKDLIALLECRFSKDASALIEVNRKFYAGDHWQGGAGWVGQVPPQDHPDRATIMSEIQRGFVSENTIGEVIKRHLGGILGREPAWDYVLRRPLVELRTDNGTPMRDARGRIQREQPTTDEQSLLHEADTSMTGWWDARKPLAVLREAVTTALLSGRGVLRVYVPRGYRDEQGRVRRPNLSEALSLIRIHAPDVLAAGTIIDDTTEIEAGVFLSTDVTTKEQRVELSYLDEQGRTVIRSIVDEAVDESEPLDLGGRLTIYELRRDALITEQVRQNQRAENLAATKMLRNVNTAGDRERIFLNAEPPTRETDETDPTTGEKKRVPVPYKSGGGVTNFAYGVAVRDPQTKKIIERLSPSVTVFDPSPIEVFVGTADFYYAKILHECQQTHALIAGDATASGRSREQARAEYEDSLKLTKTGVDDALRWLLETVLYFAAHIAGQPGRFAGLRAEVNTHVDTGPVSPEARQENRADYQAGGLSQETYISRNGVDDVDAELERIAATASGSTSGRLPGADEQEGDVV